MSDDKSREVNVELGLRANTNDKRKKEEGEKMGNVDDADD